MKYVWSPGEGRGIKGADTDIVAEGLAAAMSRWGGFTKFLVFMRRFDKYFVYPGNVWRIGVSVKTPGS